MLLLAALAAFYLLGKQGALGPVGWLAGGSGGGGWGVLHLGAGHANWRPLAVMPGAKCSKVVWPARKEAIQMTAYVFGFVVLMALFLWLTDKTLEWVFYDLILGWKK